MTTPKKVYLSQIEIETLRHRTVHGKLEYNYISVEWLNEWIGKQSNEDSAKYVLDELLTEINKP